MNEMVSQIAAELALRDSQVRAAIELLAEGHTVPFLARYRKEKTGSLDEVALRAIEERSAYLRELEERRRAILKSLEELGKLTDSLEAQVVACTSKAALEDLYLPYRPKRRTRATIARERGLQPLADRILEQPAGGSPLQEAESLGARLDPCASTVEALQGARDIVAEVISELAPLRAALRSHLQDHGTIRARVLDPAHPEAPRFAAYDGFAEAVRGIPSHRYLALRRGEREGVLKVSLEGDGLWMQDAALRLLQGRPQSPFFEQLVMATEDSLKRLLLPSLETDLRVELKLRSDRAAVDVFAENLRNLLMAAPLGARRVIGVDPGIRTGSKCVVVDETGAVLEHQTLYVGRGAREEEQAKATLIGLVRRHQPWGIGVGNGTGGRETEAFFRKVLKENDLATFPVVSVNEAGASIYSASDIARHEFPHLDLTLRGAISIARRLQDPLAELVKIDPKSIGVGQYQHDVHQPLLHKKLEEVVESCVNRVGVELNTASAPLLTFVAGVGPGLAEKIVRHREEHGPFRSRRDLLKVAGLGPKTFEQAAGFVRVHEGAHPLDRSGVHPERYPLVERMASDIGLPIAALVGSAEAALRIDWKRYVSEEIGEPTLVDILEELKKPGRDPRDTFEAPRFRDDLHRLEDVSVGMVLEGVVTNVTAFGAFVDIGVHQDGLVHISQLSERYVRDPSEVVRVGDKMRVRVLDVDIDRRRLSLSARMEAPAPDRAPAETGPDKTGKAKPARSDARRVIQSAPPRAAEEVLTHRPFAALQRAPQGSKKGR